MRTPDAVLRRRPRAIHRTGRCAALLLTSVLLLGAGAAAAAPAGVALVIGEGAYPGQSVLPACSQGAHAVAARLQRLGFTVDQAIDAPGSAVRDVLDSFAAHVAAAHVAALGQPPLVYVCAEAALVGARLFMLPADVDLRGTLRPETQGIVVRSLFRILAGSNGAMVIELGVPAGTGTAAAVTSLRQALPDGLNLALTLGDGTQAGAFGRLLASDASDPAQRWEHLEAALRGTGGGGVPAMTVFAPDPVPAAPVAPSPAAPPATDATAGASPVGAAPPAAAGGAAAAERASPPPSEPAGKAPAPGAPVPVANAAPAPAPAPGPGPAPDAGPAPSAGPASNAEPAASADAAPAQAPSASRPTAPEPAAPFDAGGPSSPHDLSQAPPSAATVPAASAHGRPPAAVWSVPGGAPPAREHKPERIPSREAVPDPRTRRLQAALAFRGFYRGPLNGVASPRTLRAIRAYQAALGDPPTGALTQTEIVRLLNNW
jgi:hypothetical protein